MANQGVMGNTPPSRNALTYYWEGEGPLWRVFWVWGVLGSWILFGLFAFAYQNLGLSWGFFAIATLVMLPYTAWILASVWQCCQNTGSDVWSNLARFATAVWALNIGIAGGLILSELVLG